MRGMHRTEADLLVDCWACGASIAPEIDRAFAISDDAYLCFECAVRRGGVFDDEEDRWTIPPIVLDLPDERRPHL